MQVLAKNQRLVPRFRLRCKGDDLLQTVIHPVEYIRWLSVPVGLIMNRSCGIIHFYELVHRLVVPAVERLIAKWPDYNAWMVYSQLEEAFCLMQTGKHIGKMVLKAGDDDIVPVSASS